MRYFLFVILLFTLTSCYHVYYAPNTPNVSLLAEAKEVRVTGGVIVGMESEFGGADLQLAYSPANHFGVMMNGFTAANRDGAGMDMPDQGTGRYGEIGVGYYTAVDPKKHWIFEVYGGAGVGKVRNDYGDGDYMKVSINKLFIQPAFGYKWDYVEVALAPRISHVNWKPTEQRITSDRNLKDITHISQHPRFFSFEPGMIFRAGTKKIKAQLGFTIASQEWDNNTGSQSPRESFVINLGFSFNLPIGRLNPDPSLK